MISRSSSFMSNANVGRGALSLNTNVVMSQGSQVPPVSAAPDGCSAAVAGGGLLTGEAGRGGGAGCAGRTGPMTGGRGGGGLQLMRGWAGGAFHSPASG